MTVKDSQLQEDLRRDTVLKRMLKTPPKLHKDEPRKRPKPEKSKDSKK